MSETKDYIWDGITVREGKIFTTHRGRQFSFHVRKTRHGEPLGEIEIDGSSTVISRATAMLACYQAQEIQKKKGYVKSPGKLGTHGAVYLYPILIDMGIMSSEPGVVPKASLMPDKIVTMATDLEASPVKCCVYCGYTTEEDFGFCPKCGRKF